MVRPLLLCVLLSCGDDELPAEDPATSKRCVELRMRVLEDEFLLGEAERRGVNSTAVASKRLEISQYKSKNLQCFR